MKRTCRLGLGAAVAWSVATVASSAEPAGPILVGPGRVCFKYSSFDLLADERIETFDAGVHGAIIQITGPAGSYSISEGNHFARRGVRARVEEGRGVKVYRGRVDGKLVYGVEWVLPNRTGQPQIIVWIAGAALTGQDGDRAVYRRVTAGDPATMKCDQRFTYGWDAVPPEPLPER